MNRREFLACVPIIPLAAAKQGKTQTLKFKDGSPVNFKDFVEAELSEAELRADRPLIYVAKVAWINVEDNIRYPAFARWAYDEEGKFENWHKYISAGSVTNFSRVNKLVWGKVILFLNQWFGDNWYIRIEPYGASNVIEL